MASVIGSARTATASVFDVVTQAANAASSLIRTAALSADALDLKAREMHAGVRSRSVANMVVCDRREIMLAANEYVSLLEETHRELYPSVTFDRIGQTNLIVLEMSTALEAEKKRLT
jgi:hypothetical protein